MVCKELDPLHRLSAWMPHAKSIAERKIEEVDLPQFSSAPITEQGKMLALYRRGRGNGLQEGWL